MQNTDIEDNVGDSTLRRLWNGAHTAGNDIIVEMNKSVEDIRQYVVERRKKEHDTNESAKRAVLQFLTGIGWIKK